jgi:hypothetical protein
MVLVRVAIFMAAASELLPSLDNASIAVSTELSTHLRKRNHFHWSRAEFPTVRMVEPWYSLKKGFTHLNQLSFFEKNEFFEINDFFDLHM